MISHRTGCCGLLSLFCAVFTDAPAHAQPWVDTVYSVVKIANIHYGTATGFDGQPRQLYLDLFLPVCTSNLQPLPRPLALFIHGGAFLAGDKNDASIQSYCQNFAKRGYVTASVGYRLGFVSDDTAHYCNYPNYSCIFATDPLEWERAYFRGVQDVKGALRYLINRHAQYHIDTANVFLAGESAGAFLALGAALLDTLPEKPAGAYAQPAAPPPAAVSVVTSCAYNQGVSLGAPFPRPDLGDIDGHIEPSAIRYVIRGVGNMYGGMLSNLLALHRAGAHKPGIFQFHQPCDIIVPIDSGAVFWGLSWCFTNGYNCQAISNTISFYGSRQIRHWNTTHQYGYPMRSEFTNRNFPYNFFFGPGSCLDQAINSCHAYDNRVLRERQMAEFFAGLITTSSICALPNAVDEPAARPVRLAIWPNPASSSAVVAWRGAAPASAMLVDALGRVAWSGILQPGDNTLSVDHLVPGIYRLIARSEAGQLDAATLARTP